MLTYVAFMALWLHVECQARASTEDPKEIIARAVLAHGSKHHLAKLATLYVRATVNITSPNSVIPCEFEYWRQDPDKVKMIMTARFNGMKMQEKRVLVGMHAWRDVDGEVTKMSAPLTKKFQASIYQNRLQRLYPILDDDSFHLAMIPPTILNGKPVIGVKVSSAEHTDTILYFDRSTYMLLKSDSSGTDPDSGETLSVEEWFADYKIVSGAKYPMKKTVWLNGRKQSEDTVIKCHIAESFDPSLFRLP